VRRHDPAAAQRKPGDDRFKVQLPANAQQAPWDAPKPRGMTEAHERYADSALEVYNRLGDAFNGNPKDFHRRIWTWLGGRNQITPISNMDGAELTNLLNGRYFVYRNTDRGDVWSVRYYAPSGETHFCIGQRNGSYKEYSMDRYVHRVAFGLSGHFHWDPRSMKTARPDLGKEYAWPVVANGKTGQISDFAWGKGRWASNTGWIQAEYAAGFAEKCPKLPRVSLVNNDQRGTSIQEMARGARAVTGFRTAFENDPANPLTVGMFYWAHPPR
jgi:hypothetical protein